MNVDGWESKPLSELVSLIMDFRGRTPKKLDMEWGGGEVPALSANNVEMGKINFSKECYFGSDALYKKWMTKGNIQKGDVILTTEAPLGNVALIPDERRYILSQRVILIRANSSNLCNDYLSHYLMSEFFQNLMRQQSSGTTATGIQRAKLEPLPISFPTSKIEQKQIAAVLSSIDRAIAQTEALIAKQQRIKTGLMQDLLTKGIDENGNIRSEETHEFKDSPLGRIPVEWKVETIGRIASLQRGHDIIESDLIPGQYPVIASSGIIGFHNISTSSSPNVVVGRKGSIGNIHYIETDFWAHDTSLFVTNFFGNLEKYVYYLFLYLKLEKYGTKSGSPSLNRNDVHPLKVGLPSPSEQKQITKIISEVDKFIIILNKELNKFKHKKTGLMQDLLTGKVRVTELLKDQEEVSP
jgi:type I restriction enzyme, S subunit